MEWSVNYAAPVLRGCTFDGSKGWWTNYYESEDTGDPFLVEWEDQILWRWAVGVSLSFKFQV